MKEDRLVLGEANAKNELTQSLSDSTIHNVIKTGTLLIKDKMETKF